MRRGGRGIPRELPKTPITDLEQLNLPVSSLHVTNHNTICMVLHAT